jgi:hypothetical protein
MGSASWPRSGSLSGWQDFGHEDGPITRNDQVRAQLGSLLLPVAGRNCQPGLHCRRHRADTPGTADSRDRVDVRMC